MKVTIAVVLKSDSTLQHEGGCVGCHSVCAGPLVAQYGVAAALQTSLRTFSANMLMSVGSDSCRSGLVLILHEVRKASLDPGAAARVRRVCSVHSEGRAELQQLLHAGRKLSSVRTLWRRGRMILAGVLMLFVRGRRNVWTCHPYLTLPSHHHSHHFTFIQDPLHEPFCCRRCFCRTFIII